jgi:hypothetical protein
VYAGSSEEGEKMRRGLFTAIVVLVVLAGVLPATAESAGGTRVRYYEGPTSNGGRLSIGVRVSDGVARLDHLLIDGPYRCADGTEGQIGTGVGWGGNGGPMITDQQLELSENWQVIAFMVSGRIGPHRGSGTVTFLLPGLTADEQAQLCTMGETTWTVERTAGEDFPFGPAVVQRAGGRTVTSGFGSAGSAATTALARAENRSIRHYHGRTSQGLPMAARTRRADAGIALLGLTLGFELACDDGTEFEGGSRPSAYFEATVVLPPGRLDLDSPPGLFPAESFHVHGELDAHSGSGTLTMIWPIITEDLQAQLCKSGEQTWELWRTDAGY